MKRLPPMKIIKTLEKDLLKLVPDENPTLPKKVVFQEIRKQRTTEPVYTLEHAAAPRVLSKRLSMKYPVLVEQHTDYDYQLRGVENEHTLVHNFPTVTDFLVVGGGLIGSATAYYLKKICSRAGDVVVIDKNPFSPSSCTATSNGLISCQSKNRDVSRIATLSKEILRGLQTDVIVTDEDWAKINYRPVTHLVLWPQHEVDEVTKFVDDLIDDGNHVDTKVPRELEIMFPWLKVFDSDVCVGTHGCQDEAVVDPIALRNLYRTLAQAYGVSFIAAEAIDFNTSYLAGEPLIHPYSVGALVARMPTSRELKSVAFASTILALGHDTPFLEERSELEPFMRDSLGDLHFVQPKVRFYFCFQSQSAPIINFPVITDTDGSVLIREDHAGNFKYYLTYEDSELLLMEAYEALLDDSIEDPYPNLFHKNSAMESFFDQVIKPRLVKRIPCMEDAKFNFAHSGYESYNTHDGQPIIGPHEFHSRILLSAGYGPRLMTFAPAVAMILTELCIAGEEETYDLTNFYWKRIASGRKLLEFTSLTQ